MEDTIIAVSTPIGKGAISLIRMTGENVIEIVSKFVFIKNINLLSIESKKVYLAKIIEQEIIDEVIVYFMKGPHTYTGENVFEISCHNNTYILDKILKIAVFCGARLARAGEFTQRAFLNGKMDLSRAEAVLDVIHAESNIAEKIAQKQLKGSLSKEINLFRDKILDILKNIEVFLDHEGILELDKNNLLNDLIIFKKGLDEKIKIGESVNKLFSGFKIALFGRPNVGKSSLLNSILNVEKAIVSDIPGTTRDLIEVVIEHNNVKVEIVDTAGIKHSDEMDEKNIHTELEKKGIEKTKNLLEKIDFVFFIIDLSIKITEYDYLLFDEINLDKDLILVLNKKDIEIEDKNREQYINFIKNKFSVKNIIKISAKNNENINNLLDLVVSKDIEIFENNHNFMINSRHSIVFQEVSKNLDEAINLLKLDEELEIIAIYLRNSVNIFGEILGVGIDEEILNRIFNNFCIGK